MSKLKAHLSHLENSYREYKLQYNKKSVEEFLIQKAAKTIIPVLFDKSLFDSFPNADKVLKGFFVCHTT